MFVLSGEGRSSAGRLVRPAFEIPGSKIEATLDARLTIRNGKFEK